MATVWNALRNELQRLSSWKRKASAAGRYDLFAAIFSQPSLFNWSSKAAPNVPEMSRKFIKDVNSDGTNPRSPLESTKVPKKRTQNGCKRGRKTCPE
jgi:hypothetical protein